MQFVILKKIRIYFQLLMLLRVYSNHFLRDHTGMVVPHVFHSWMKYTRNHHLYICMCDKAWRVLFNLLPFWIDSNHFGEIKMAFAINQFLHCRIWIYGKFMEKDFFFFNLLFWYNILSFIDPHIDRYINRFLSFKVFRLFSSLLLLLSDQVSSQNCPVGWDGRIHGLLLCWGVRLHQWVSWWPSQLGL